MTKLTVTGVTLIVTMGPEVTAPRAVAIWGAAMTKNRRALAAIAAAIAVLAIYLDPQGSAGAVRGVLDLATEAADGVITFATAVVQ